MVNPVLVVEKADTVLEEITWIMVPDDEDDAAPDVVEAKPHWRVLVVTYCR